MGNSERPSLSAQKSSWKARGTGSRDVYAPSSFNRRRVFLKSPSVKGGRTFIESSDMSGSMLSGLRSSFVRCKVHISWTRILAIRSLGNCLEDGELK